MGQTRLVFVIGERIMRKILAFAGVALLAGTSMLPDHEALAHGGGSGGGHGGGFGGGGFHGGGFSGGNFRGGGFGGRGFGHFAARNGFQNKELGHRRFGRTFGFYGGIPYYDDCDS